ncbi:sensor histidine kinase [Nocardiopsis mangrovi]|uniref:Sensor histidine kinase n=1 Tax=Nocardiopsis mangrovi TaxID=1179818 RepID=A0ABV9DYY6_9ACTN
MPDSGSDTAAEADGRTIEAAAATPGPSAGGAGLAPGTGLGGGSSRAELRRLRYARWLVMSAFVILALAIPFFAGLGVLNSLATGEIPLWRNAPAFALSLPLAWLCVRMVTSRLADRAVSPERMFWASLALVAAIAVLLDVYTWTLMLIGAWWSMAALVAPRARMAAIAVVLLMVPWVRIGLLPAPDFLLLFRVWAGAIVWGLFMLGANAATLFMWDVATEALAARDARARLAVSEERLRFARDMHDLLGHSLSGIAVKSELAARLAERDPARAAQEMAEVQRLAREALREVRTAVSGYREVDLASEVAGVRAVLGAAGIRCTADVPDDDALPAGSASLAAWVVREGATNALRHSTAKSCDLSVRIGERAVVVEVYNDGVRADARDRSAPHYGNGLSGLTERVAAAGGSLSASATGDGGFLLRAVLPAPGTKARERGAPRDGREDVTV